MTERENQQKIDEIYRRTQQPCLSPLVLFAIPSTAVLPLDDEEKFV